MVVWVVAFGFGMRYGGSIGDTLEGKWLITTDDGGYAIVGTWKSGGQHDIFLLKVDSLGSVEWVKTYGGMYREWGDYVYQTDDGGYIVGGSTESWGAGRWDIFIVKTDAGGNVEWAKAFGYVYGDCKNCLSRTRVEFARSVVQLPDGTYLVNGVVDTVLARTTGYYGIFVMKLDPSGNLLSFRTIERGTYAGYGFPGVLHKLPDGNYVFCASLYWDDLDWWDGTIFKVDPDGNLIWARRYYSSRYTRDNFDDCYLSPYGSMFVTGSSEEWGRFAMKIDSSGNVNWLKSLGTGFSNLRIVGIGTLPDIWLGGNFSGYEILTRMDTLGNVYRMRSFNVGNSESVMMQPVGADGIAILTNVDLNSTFLLRTDTAGSIHSICDGLDLSPTTTTHHPRVEEPLMVTFSGIPIQTNVALSAVPITPIAMEICPLGHEETKVYEGLRRDDTSPVGIYTVSGQKVRNVGSKGIFFVRTPYGLRKVIRR